MLLVRDVDERGQERVIVLPLGSVVSYFTGCHSGGGITLHIQPGLCAFPAQFEAQSSEVRRAVLVEAVQRLGVPPEEVERQPFVKLLEVTEPDLSVQYAMFSRRRSKGRSGPYSR